jgi:hypothetical protein
VSERVVTSHTPHTPAAFAPKCYPTASYNNNEPGSSEPGIAFEYSKLACMHPPELSGVTPLSTMMLERTTVVPSTVNQPVSSSSMKISFPFIAVRLLPHTQVGRIPQVNRHHQPSAIDERTALFSHDMGAEEQDVARTSIIELETKNPCPIGSACIRCFLVLQSLGALYSTCKYLGT